MISILRVIGIVVSGVLALPVILIGMLIGMLTGLFFSGVDRADREVEKQFGEQYSQARKRIIEALYKVFVVSILIIGTVFLLSTCFSSLKNSECEWSGRGQIC